MFSSNQKDALIQSETQLTVLQLERVAGLYITLVYITLAVYHLGETPSMYLNLAELIVS